MNRAPRPSARVLLAGRYLSSRTALLALPEGPVSGLDLATGELVGLSLGDGADDPGEIRARIVRANALGVPGSPQVHDLRWHLGRPLVAFPAVVPAPHFVGDPLVCAGAAGALGEALDVAGLGLPGGAADLELGSDGPRLRRPPIATADPAVRSSVLLASRVPPLLRAVRATAIPEPLPARSSPRRHLPASRRLRLALLVACGTLSAIAVSGLRGSSHGAPSARAGPLPTAVAPAAVARPVRQQPLIPVPASRVVALARGGPARVLLRPVAKAVRRSSEQPTAVRVAAPASPPEAGWVAALFVGP